MKKKMTKAQKIKRLKAMKPGLYRNMALKKLGAGATKKKRKKGAKGAPTKADFVRSAKTAKTAKKKKK
tara:strand:- start:551 stop:754 length:204 start_codon:yes stop_codon:yes gene_type:complete